MQSLVSSSLSMVIFFLEYCFFSAVSNFLETCLMMFFFLFPPCCCCWVSHCSGQCNCLLACHDVALELHLLSSGRSSCPWSLLFTNTWKTRKSSCKTTEPNSAWVFLMMLTYSFTLTCLELLETCFPFQFFTFTLRIR